MKSFFFCSLLLAVFTARAQKPDSVQLNGAYYYIYPYPQEAHPSAPLESAIYLSVNLRQLLKASNPKMTRKEIDEVLKAYGQVTTNASSKPINKLIKASADRFYQTDYDLESDIIPALDQLPDGKYIQYFSNYMAAGEKGEFAEYNTKIAGFFELKNNLLEGNAYWLNIIGDTVKKGTFRNGLKEGPWMLSSFFHSRYYTKKEAQRFLNGKQMYLTSISTFANGVLNGPYESKDNGVLTQKGAYTDGRESGEWFFYSVERYFSDTSVLVKHYTLANKQPVSHKPYVRDGYFGYGNTLPYKYYAFSDYHENPGIDFTGLRRIAGNKNEALELPEEEFTAYEGENYGEGEFVYPEFSEDENLAVDDRLFAESIYLGGKFISKAKVLDSIGIINTYDGVYEEFYGNGKLKMRLLFENGDLVSEDTIFWDHGVPADVVIYDPNKKEYENSKMDYNGVVYEINVFDSTGMFSRQKLDPFYRDKHILIDGLDAAIVSDYSYVEIQPQRDYNSNSEFQNSWNYFSYGNPDTLKSNALHGKIILSETWFPDTTKWATELYDADERVMTREVRSLNGSINENSRFEFDNEFNTVRGTTVRNLKDLSFVTKFNGSYPFSYLGTDSFPAIRVAYPESVYELTSEEILNFRNEPFSGKATFNLKARSAGFSIQKNRITINFGSGYKFYNSLYKDYAAYLKTGETKYSDVLSVATKTGAEYETAVYAVFPFLLQLIPSDQATYQAIDQKNVKNAIAHKAEGSFLDGKPNGTWTVYDQFGKVIVVCNFHNGEPDGILKQFAYENPVQDNYMSYEYDPQTLDSLPEKPVYYLNRETAYRNGTRSGNDITYDWLGNVRSRTAYSDGYPAGPAYGHNSVASTFMNYENGSLDGIVRTMLHLPGRDSILLYELNFQDGALQGESRSYHTNGKLSKRGFFLNGMPIDDYEGYDSLGTRFHYVRFQYSFPVEEKIWESNQLSVRYLFDWRDSIYFRPDDIVEATSVDNLLYQYGLLGNQYSEPYFGRPSLVDKAGIDYHMTKYFPNDTICRDGDISSGKKTGCWQYFSYDGEKLYDVEYYDTIISLNDSIQFKSKGMLYNYDKKGNLLSKSFIIEKFEKYDCSHTDHYEIRQFYTTWQAHDSVGRINGYVKNYYDNGTIQSEGTMKNGLPEGIWKYYDPFGKLNHVGEYVLGKRNGRWLSGDLSKTKYLGDICMNPNLPDLEEQMKYQEKLLDIYIRYFKSGKLLQSEYYGLNLNDFEEPEAVDE